jgi:hypothetical protein
MNGYWKLLCKILEIPICRKCGRKLDKDFRKRRHGYLCHSCLCNIPLDIATAIDFYMLQ